jgi:hypothetical protein
MSRANDRSTRLTAAWHRTQCCRRPLSPTPKHVASESRAGCCGSARPLGRIVAKPLGRRTRAELTTRCLCHVHCSADSPFAAWIWFRGRKENVCRRTGISSNSTGGVAELRTRPAEIIRSKLGESDFLECSLIKCQTFAPGNACSPNIFAGAAHANEKAVRGRQPRRGTSGRVVNWSELQWNSRCFRGASCA